MSITPFFHYFFRCFCRRQTGARFRCLCFLFESLILTVLDLVASCFGKLFPLHFEGFRLWGRHRGRLHLAGDDLHRDLYLLSQHIIPQCFIQVTLQKTLSANIISKRNKQYYRSRKDQNRQNRGFRPENHRV